VNEKRVQISVDKRTNSLVASGPKEDLLVIEALLLRLDTQKTPKTKVEDSKATKR
jgi:type II secretory pathway component GspD/PulD (secretin)